MAKYMNLFCKEKGRLTAFIVKAKEYRLLSVCFEIIH